jgi:hypothetical protein
VLLYHFDTANLYLGADGKPDDMYRLSSESLKIAIMNEPIIRDVSNMPNQQATLIEALIKQVLAMAYGNRIVIVASNVSTYSGNRVVLDREAGRYTYTQDKITVGAFSRVKDDSGSISEVPVPMPVPSLSVLRNRFDNTRTRQSIVEAQDHVPWDVNKLNVTRTGFGIAGFPVAMNGESAMDAVGARLAAMNLGNLHGKTETAFGFVNGLTYKVTYGFVSTAQLNAYTMVSEEHLPMFPKAEVLQRFWESASFSTIVAKQEELNLTALGRYYSRDPTANLLGTAVKHNFDTWQIQNHLAVYNESNATKRATIHVRTTEPARVSDVYLAWATSASKDEVARLKSAKCMASVEVNPTPGSDVSTDGSISDISRMLKFISLAGGYFIIGDKVSLHKLTHAARLLFLHSQKTVTPWFQGYAQNFYNVPISYVGALSKFILNVFEDARFQWDDSPEGVHLRALVLHIINYFGIAQYRHVNPVSKYAFGAIPTKADIFGNKDDVYVTNRPDYPDANIDNWLNSGRGGETNAFIDGVLNILIRAMEDPRGPYITLDSQTRLAAKHMLQSMKSTLWPKPYLEWDWNWGGYDDYVRQTTCPLVSFDTSTTMIKGWGFSSDPDSPKDTITNLELVCAFDKAFSWLCGAEWRPPQDYTDSDVTYDYYGYTQNNVITIFWNSVDTNQQESEDAFWFSTYLHMMSRALIEHNQTDLWQSRYQIFQDATFVGMSTGAIDMYWRNLLAFADSKQMRVPEYIRDLVTYQFTVTSSYYIDEADNYRSSNYVIERTKDFYWLENLCDIIFAKLPRYFNLVSSPFFLSYRQFGDYYDPSVTFWNWALDDTYGGPYSFTVDSMLTLDSGGNWLVITNTHEAVSKRLFLGKWEIDWRAMAFILGQNPTLRDTIARYIQSQLYAEHLEIRFINAYYFTENVWLEYYDSPTPYVDYELAKAFNEDFFEIFNTLFPLTNQGYANAFVTLPVKRFLPSKGVNVKKSPPVGAIPARMYLGWTAPLQDVFATLPNSPQKMVTGLDVLPSYQTYAGIAAGGPTTTDPFIEYHYANVSAKVANNYATYIRLIANNRLSGLTIKSGSGRFFSTTDLISRMRP